MKEPDNYEYDLRIVKSPVPYIAVGAFWILYALLFPLYLWYHFIIAGAISVGIYWLSTRVFPAKQIKVRREHQIELSGDKETDKLIREARANIKHIEANAAVIEPMNPYLSADARVLVDSGCKILDYIAQYPDSVKLVRRFLAYYLPTLDKLLSSYIDFRKHDTAEETVREIEETVPEMKEVFKKQMEKLLSDRELDISTDIDVLESKLNQIK